MVVLGGVDPALGGDGVGPARGVVEGEDLDPVAELAQSGGGGGPGQAGADHDDGEPALVVGVDEADGELVVGPLVGDRPGGDLGVELGGHGQPPTRPKRTASGMMMFPRVMKPESPMAR